MILIELVKAIQAEREREIRRRDRWRFSQDSGRRVRINRRGQER
jgi:hypothetical protein